MSRTKKDILDTEAMLTRLASLLAEHANRQPDEYWNGCARTDAESLRRISMTLRRWHERECNGEVEVEETEPFRAVAFLPNDRNRENWYPVPNTEKGARKRLAKILKSYPALTAYVQGDPRGCALYILKPGDVPEGTTIDSCYSRGLAVYR